MRLNICKYFLRAYKKGLFRVPKAVVSMEEANLINKNIKSTKLFKKDEEERYNKLYIPNTTFTYENISKDDTRIGQFISMCKSNNEKYIFLEGCRLITEAIQANIKLKTIYFTDLQIFNQIPLLKIKYNVDILKIKERQLKLWSEMDSPPGIFAISTLPKNLTSNNNALPITIIITDMINENILGSIIRSFVSANVLRILYIPDCCNIWNCKTLRSGAGSHFYIPIQPIIWEDILKLIFNTPNVYLYNICKESDYITNIEMNGNKECDLYKFKSNVEFNYNRQIYNNYEALDPSIHKMTEELNTVTDFISDNQIAKHIDISELKYEGGNVCLIVGVNNIDINKNIRALQEHNKIKYITFKEKLLPVTSMSILIFQICRLISTFMNNSSI